MAKRKDNTSLLKISVTRSFPFRTLVSVDIKKEGKYIYDHLEISKEDAVYLFNALSTILEQEPKVVKPKDVAPWAMEVEFKDKKTKKVKNVVS